MLIPAYAEVTAYATRDGIITGQTPSLHAPYASGGCSLEVIVTAIMFIVVHHSACMWG